MKYNRGLVWLAVGLLVILLIVLAARSIPGGPFTTEAKTMSLVRLLLVGLMISGAAWAALRRNTGQALKFLAVWVVIGGLLALVYQVVN